jgi:cobalamin-dependent methionine synthase I
MAFGNGKAKKDKVTESGSGLDEKENGDNNSTIAKNKSKDYTPENRLHYIFMMVFDKYGQAATEEVKKLICKRNYDILVNDGNFPLEDIVFDPNMLTISTGMEEHADFGVNFINATKRIKELCPYVKINDVVSNLSLRFQGVMKIHESIHSVFSSSIYHGL